MRNATAAARPVNASGVAVISVWVSAPVSMKAARKSWRYVGSGSIPVARSTMPATRKANASEATGTATESHRGCDSLRSTEMRMRSARQIGGRGAGRRPPRPRLALGAADDSPHEPVHPVQAVRAALEHLHPHALGHAQLPALVIERPRELVELAGPDLLLHRRDLGLRGGVHARPVRRDLREAVLDRAVVEPRLPRAGHPGLDPLEVVRAPVVHRRR